MNASNIGLLFSLITILPMMALGYLIIAFVGDFFENLNAKKRNI